MPWIYMRNRRPSGHGLRRMIEREPITPFVDRVQELVRQKEVSTILVIGGSSEYLQTADRIYMMKDYLICQVTAAAKSLQTRYAIPMGVSGPKPEPADFNNRDEVDANYLSTRPEGSATEVLKVSELGFLILGEEQIDIRMLHDIASLPQLNAIAFLVRRLIGQLNPLDRYQKFALEGGTESGEIPPKWINRKEEVQRLLAEIEGEGLESAYSPFFTECGRWMDLPRKYEILAVLSRMKY